MEGTCLADYREQRAEKQGEAGSGWMQGLRPEALAQKSIPVDDEDCQNEGPQHGQLVAAFKARPPPLNTYYQHLT